MSKPNRCADTSCSATCRNRWAARSGVIACGNGRVLNHGATYDTATKVPAAKLANMATAAATVRLTVDHLGQIQANAAECETNQAVGKTARPSTRSWPTGGLPAGNTNANLRTP